MGKLHLEEFMWRGRPEGDSREPTYHVVLGETVTDAFGRDQLNLSPPLTPHQAKALGFPLPKLLSAINADMLNAHAALRQRHAELEAKIEHDATLKLEDFEALQKQHAALVRHAANLTQANDDLQAQLSVAKAPKESWLTRAGAIITGRA